MKIILSVIGLFFAIVTDAQTSADQKIKPDSLYYKNPFFRLYPEIRNRGQILNIIEEAALFNKVPEASVCYKKYRARQKAGLYFMAGFFLSSSISAISFDKANKALAGAGLSLSLCTFINGIVFLSSGEANLKRAIKYYNRINLNSFTPGY